MSAETVPADRLIGSVLASRYQIEYRIGEGAMGAVYKARHVKVGRPFAVKVLHARLLEDKKVALRFEREAELAGRLRHPNVVGVVDVGEIDGLRYMVMDFAEGPDLAALLAEAPMPPQRIIHLVRQMLEGLYHAHEQGLIHRDFKPENVIVERDTHGNEVPKIVDFGIAILRDAGDSTSGDGRLTTNGLVLGTPHYMAPEQAVADPIDHRIDLFALGIVIYELLSGKLPFDGSGAEIARANLLLDPPPIIQRVPFLEVDPLLEAFVRKLMAKKRELRPPTAKAARELLDLIDRDPRAAAVALGLPVTASDRAPATTVPVARTVAERPPAPVEAPPASASVAQREVSTAMASPLDWTPRRSRMPMIVAGLATLAASLAIALFVMRGEDEPAGEPPPEQVATVTPPPLQLQQPQPQPAPPPAPPPVEPPPTHDEAPPPVPPSQPTHAKVTPSHKQPHGGAKTIGETKPPQPEVKAPPVEIKPPPVESKPPPVETKPPEPIKTPSPVGISAAALSDLYYAVGKELTAMRSDPGDPLRERYSKINVQKSMISQQQSDRDQAATELLELRRLVRQK